MVNFHTSKPELSNIDKTENFDRSKFNIKRSSLRNFKNWSPFSDSSETLESKKSTKDDHSFNTTGIVKRMANSISSQILNRSSTSFEKSKSTPFSSKTSIKTSQQSNLDKSTDEQLYSKVKSFVSNSTRNTQTRDSKLYLKETVNGLNIHLKEPHLISVLIDSSNPIESDNSDKLNKTSIKFFPLKLGKTTIGSSDKNDLVINGSGIEPEHCFIENHLRSKSSDNLLNKDNNSNNRRSLTSIFKRNKSKDMNCSTNSIILNPIGKLCALDGVLIEAPCVLIPGSVICFGESEYFRYNNPNDETNTLNRQEVKSIQASSSRNSIIKESKLEINVKDEASQTKEEHNKKMLSNKDCQLISLESQTSESDPKTKDLNSKDNEDKRLSKVRFNIPEKPDENDNEHINIEEDKLAVNKIKNRFKSDHSETSTKSLIERKSPSKKFLSKLNKFELLSRGIETKLDESSNSSSSQSDLSSTSLKQKLINQDLKMLRQNLTKKEFLKVREARSKSFGCEKELHLKKKSKKNNQVNKLTPKCEPKHDSIKKHFNIEESLNYIDDEVSQTNENRDNENDSDDYDDNVIYEGDSADELNDFLEEDFESFDSNESDFEGDDVFKCRSAPISPSRELKKRNYENENNTNTCASFIYDVNLYNDQHNLVILNGQDELKKNLKNSKKLEKSSNNNSTESCSSTSSISSSIRLEPLVINEENSVHLTANNSTSECKTTVIPLIKKSETDTNLLCSTSLSCESKEMNRSVNNSLKNLEMSSNTSSDKLDDKPISPSSSSQSSSSCHENDKIELDEANNLKTDDSASLNDDNSQSSSSNLLSESGYCLKDNYEKAKREREMEQQIAEMEKKRLQEILDICLEFQKQEQNKQQTTNEQPNRVSSSPSLTQSIPNQQVSLSDLPSLNTILNSNQNKTKTNQNTTCDRKSAGLANQNIVLEFQQQQQQQQKNQQCQQQIKNQIDKLNKEKCELISSLNSLKQKIKDIEMRQNEAIRDLEMERALLDVEQTSELKIIQTEENKIKHLHQEHQLKLESFNLHTNQIRNDIKIVQMTIKNIENEILILDTTLDTNFLLSGNCLDSTRIDWENIKNQKEHALEEARRAHEDLEFQLMELEAKYETELEDIQNRLIKEQEILIESFKYKHNTLNNYDQEQQKLILQMKSETEILEVERQKLIDQFQKQRNQLQIIEKKLQKISEYPDLRVFNENLELAESINNDLQDDSPSPASSSVSLSSATNSSETSPSMNQQFKPQEPNSGCKVATPASNYVHPLILPQLQQIQNQLLQSSFNQSKNPNYKKQLSQSFRDILENTLLINGISEINNINRNYVNQARMATLSPVNQASNVKNQRYSRCLNKSTCSLNNQTAMGVAANVSCLTGSVNQSKIPASLNSSQHLLIEKNDLIDEYEKRQPSPIDTQIALKFAELERNLAMSKAENNNLLEKQYQARERELFLLQEEKRKRADLERQLNDEKNLRMKICEENIKLRDKKQTQARPLTRYLPVRDNNFDLKLHVENSGHNLLNQIDPSTKQPLVFINSNICRGYLLKMGQKFKTWNKRWFVFDRTKRTLCYYLDKHETKLRGSIYFQSINEVYVDHMRTIKSPDSKSTFVVKTMDRNFYLVAPSSELMRIWIDVIFTGAEGYLEFIE